MVVPVTRIGASQRMVGGQEQDAGLLVQRLDTQVRVVERQATQTDVHAALAQRRGLVGPFQAPHVDLHVGVQPAEGPSGRGGTMPGRSPTVSTRDWRMRRNAACAVCSTRPSGRNASPAVVTTTERLVRSSSRVPSWASRWRTWRLTTGCATCSRRAARPKCRSSATATIARTNLRSRSTKPPSGRGAWRHRAHPRPMPDGHRRGASGLGRGAAAGALWDPWRPGHSDRTSPWRPSASAAWA